MTCSSLISPKPIGEIMTHAAMENNIGLDGNSHIPRNPIDYI
jgi:hypothetical protein